MIPFLGGTPSETGPPNSDEPLRDYERSLGLEYLIQECACWFSTPWNLSWKLHWSTRSNWPQRDDDCTGRENKKRYQHGLRVVFVNILQMVEDVHIFSTAKKICLVYSWSTSRWHSDCLWEIWSVPIDPSPSKLISPLFFHADEMAMTPPHDASYASRALLCRR